MFDKEILTRLTKENLRYDLKQVFQKMLNEYDLNEPFIAFMKINGEYECVSEDNTIYHFSYDYHTHTVYLEIVQSDALNSQYKFKNTKKLDSLNLNIRICSVCGKPITEGYTNDDGDFYYCSDAEFIRYMDELYGEGKWRPEETGNKDWCYEYFDNDEWYPQLSYYTDFC